MCGVIGIKSHREVSQDLTNSLVKLQNRGQHSHGFAIFDGKKISLKHIEGKVRNRPNISGTVGIAHVRYATSGEAKQPVNIYHPNPDKSFAFAFNGHIKNKEEIQDFLARSASYLVLDDNDTELMSHLLYYYRSLGDWSHVFQEISKRIDGAWSIVLLTGRGNIIAARDSKGYRPLCWSQNYNIDSGLNEFYVASESVALPSGGIDVLPGQGLIFTNDSIVPVPFSFAKASPSHCFFEWIYFSNVASVLDSISVYGVRRQLGSLMAQKEEILPGAIVVPVPDTARASADGFAFESGLPCFEGVVRNRYLGRTFIESKSRFEKALQKYEVLPEVVRNKVIYLVDDSLVRGTTMKALVYKLHAAWAKEIHLRICCPKIISPCHYGIDMSTSEELFCNSHDDYTKELGVNTIRWLDISDIEKTIGIPVCTKCLKAP